MNIYGTNMIQAVFIQQEASLPEFDDHHNFHIQTTYTEVVEINVYGFHMVLRSSSVESFPIILITNIGLEK